MNTETKNLDALLKPVMELAREAGRRIMEIYDTDFTVTQKDDHTPVTEADMAAHDIIMEGLTKLAPEWPILSEEAEPIPFTARAAWKHYWLVDPLDGTREFIKHSGDFTVNIALIEQHRPVLGVVYVPVSGVCYFASVNNGAFKQEGRAQPTPIHVRSCSAGQCTVVSSRPGNDCGLEDFLTKIADYQLLRVGSSLKSCMVAEGKADIYPRLGPTSEWDTAAAQCIVEEAGGQLTDTALRALRYNTKSSLLNPHFLVFGDVKHDWARFLPS